MVPARFELLTSGGRHQVLLDDALRLAARFVEENEDMIRERIRAESPWWIPGAVEDKLGDKIVKGVERTLGAVSTDPDHPLRQRYDEAVDRFVVSLQNHDQIGNRAVGDRLTEIAPLGMRQIAAVLLLTSPFTPMLFMGEEWGASTRWPYFTSHTDPGLADIGKYRREEFGSHGWDVDQMIDPQDPRAFHDAVLRWDEVAEPEPGRGGQDGVRPGSCVGKPAGQPWIWLGGRRCGSR